MSRDKFSAQDEMDRQAAKYGELPKGVYDESLKGYLEVELDEAKTTEDLKQVLQTLLKHLI